MGSSTEHSAFGRVTASRPSGAGARRIVRRVGRAGRGRRRPRGARAARPAGRSGSPPVSAASSASSRATAGSAATGWWPSAPRSIASRVFGQTVDDAARVLAVISGHDPLESTTSSRPATEVLAPPADLRGLTIGLPRGILPGRPRRPGFARQWTGASGHPARQPAPRSGKLRCRIREFAVPCYYIIAPAEAAANLARFDGVRYGPRHIEPPTAMSGRFTAPPAATGSAPEVRRRILVGTYVLSSGILRRLLPEGAAGARAHRRGFPPGVRVRGGFPLDPTTPTPAFRAGEKTADPVAMYLADIFVCSMNLAGLPAVSLPIGRDQGLPIGGQLVAPAFEEARMLSASPGASSALVPGRSEVR